MASEKDRMLGAANQYIYMITRAKNACDSATKNMIPTQMAVAEAWDSESGKAMAKAIDDLRFETVKLYALLAALEGKMQAHARSLYNSWPEEETE